MDIVERLSALADRFTDLSFVIPAAVFVLAFTVVYYYLFKCLKENNAGNLITIFFLIMFISGGIFLFTESMSSELFLIVPALLIIFVVMLYSVEIRRAIWSKKNMKLVDVKHGDGTFEDEEKIHNCINEIIKSLQNMSKNDIGAIIILSNGNVPAQILDSGVKLNCDISSELIESVFFPKTPLHDGAMIVSGTKIIAAGCFLPLSQTENIPKDLGTRHRAGIGITENIDVTSLIVSEETGIISIVKAGKIQRYADFEMLKNTLSRFYWQELSGNKK